MSCSPNPDLTDAQTSDAQTPDTPPPGGARRVRSFVIRAGRMGSGQARALQTLAPRFVLPYAAQALHRHATFGREADLVVEIGFGMGQAAAAFAKDHPGIDLLGIEVHPPGVGALLQLIDAEGLSNLRIVQHDAVDVLEHMLAPASVSGFHIFFPDPWPKKRHHKRRLIQPPLVALLASRLAPGGYVHLATDWEPYAEHMLAVLEREPSLVNASPGGYVPRPASRPVTKFERRGVALGHGVRDLVFRKA